MAAKKKAAKKTPAKKATTKKSPASKTAAVTKKAAAKPAAKKAAATKATPKKAAAKKTAAKKAAPKKAAGKKDATTSEPKKAKAKTAAATPAPSTSPSKATTKKMVVPKSTFSAKFVAAQKSRLLEERARYVSSAEVWKAEADSLLEGREPGDVQFDEESGEGDTLAIERERDLALSSHAQAAVEEIDAALKRVDEGTYGMCVTSGLAIPQERLEVIPWAAERVEYKVAGFRRR